MWADAKLSKNDHLHKPGWKTIDNNNSEKNGGGLQWITNRT